MKRSLRDKLRAREGHGVSSESKPVAGPVRGGSDLRSYLKARTERAQRVETEPPEPVELPEGAEVENARGRFWLRTLRTPLTEQHGRLRYDEVRCLDWERIAVVAKDEGLGSAELSECLFLDTETTGLSGGAGTLVFLTGLGYIDREELVVEQAFLRNFEEEPAALQHVAERIAQYPLPVTFVGKSFDRHRLAARMAVQSVESAVLQERHLDLYWCARRAFKGQLPDTKLRTVEQRRLGVFRDDDLPGSEAPRAWLDWVRDRSGPVDRVLEHNRIDVLSLVTLLADLGSPH